MSREFVARTRTRRFDFPFAPGSVVSRVGVQAVLLQVGRYTLPCVVGVDKDRGCSVYIFAPPVMLLSESSNMRERKELGSGILFAVENCGDSSVSAEKRGSKFPDLERRGTQRHQLVENVVVSKANLGKSGEILSCSCKPSFGRNILIPSSLKTE
ncbi:uncharacterized protein BCR38DRAFT_412581 [Pseudomassariella vexata]|uniref:Uncharacterized protein n=1 Tax=Pseudomassariella vexata TaxID=1141098 RepID=A0A1Y2DJZ4_9PEZI|nr:uncharacterized protein BCR38DRAFT_412581 [Pseudomassariella vexata]ORY59573.1 hypothetical protein BCR38DRAFT_412581 [Pseudomassariella vexata]